MKKWLVTCGILLLLVAAGCLFYINDYYPAAQDAQEALKPDGQVQVTKIASGWYFDGPSKDTALVFYPGGKVEETAYAPLLRRLAEEGVDSFLLKMPARLAIFGVDKAEQVLEAYPYEDWYVGGHSLGGVAAAMFAADHGEALEGVILCASYPTKELDADLTEVLLYGSEDQVLDKEKLAEARQYAPPRTLEYEIPGGNHAGFGDYGPQKGDGEASLSKEEQQKLAAEYIVKAILPARQ